MLPSSSPVVFKDTSQVVIPEMDYIVLEDLTYRYKGGHPSIIDIKMGTQTYEPTATPEKIAKEVTKYIYQKKLGFRISGMKVFNCRSKQYVIKDKYFGRALEPHTVMYGLGLFFYNGYRLCSEVISEVIRQLDGLLMVMNEQVEYKLYCTSLLIMYNCTHDTAPTTDTTTNVTSSSTSPLLLLSTTTMTTTINQSGYEDTFDKIDGRLLQQINTKLQLTAPMRRFLLTGNYNDTSKSVTVKLVDFAHVVIHDAPDRQGKDEGFILGLQNLIDCLQELLCKMQCSEGSDEAVQSILRFQ